MDRLVVLLRAVNVGGRKLSMAALRQGLTEAGCSDVVTYIQSGNVVLTPPAPAPTDRDGWLASVIGDIAGFEVGVVTRTADELDAVVARNPYPGASGTTLHVVFHVGTPDPAVLTAVSIDDFAPEQCALIGRELYLHLPNGMGRARLPVALERAGRRTEAATATARNWNTVLKLQAMAHA